jgi:hypothetical protein
LEKKASRNILPTSIKNCLVLSNSIALDESVINDIPKVSHEENAILAANFIEKEVYEAIMQMKINKAPRPYGFPAELYQSF